MSTPKIELKGVTKRFGSKVVLDGVDLSVQSGESLVIIGGSGTGKSVTLKCILGLLAPDRGSIKVDGQEVTRLSSGAREKVNRKFGMLFQSGALFDSMTVFENVAFGLRVRPRHERPSNTEIAERVERLLELVQLAHLARRAPSPRILKSSFSTSRPPASIRSWPT